VAEQPLGEMHAAGIRVHAVDAGTIAREVQDLRLVNAVMLGAVAGFLPFPAADLEALTIARFATRTPALVEPNRRAFAAGQPTERARAGRRRPLQRLSDARRRGTQRAAVSRSRCGNGRPPAGPAAAHSSRARG
jgi:hypothetical protein